MLTPLFAFVNTPKFYKKLKNPEQYIITLLLDTLSIAQPWCQLKNIKLNKKVKARI